MNRIYRFLERKISRAQLERLVKDSNGRFGPDQKDPIDPDQKDPIDPYDSPGKKRQRAVQAGVVETSGQPERETR